MSQSRSKRKLFFLLPFPPRLDATHGGGRVMAQLLSGLAARHRIALLYFRGVDEPGLDERLRERCELAEEVTRPYTGRALAEKLFRSGRLLRSLFTRNPLWVADWKSHEYSKRIHLLVQAWRPDIIQIEYHIMGQYLSSLNGSAAPRVLTAYEPGIRSAPYLNQLHPFWSRPVHALDRLAWERFEATIVRRVQAVIVFTEHDKKALEKFTMPTPIVAIPPGTLIPEHPSNPATSFPASLLFFGSFIHPPNVDAALRLVQRIFPLVQGHYPELKLFVVGDQPPSELMKMASAQVVVTGRVPDLRPYLERTTLFVAPLRLGGGIRIKVLEALAAGKAVVASRLAAEGLDVQDGRDIALADTDEEFADRIVQLLGDADRRASLAVCARAWACTNLGWDKSIAAYESLYDTLLRRTAA
jgi:glycosyltransferase involved in cell wall biosynthesis